jgi:hypothetical protein
VNLRVSLIATATLGLSAGLSLAKPTGPATGNPFPVAVLALTAQAAATGLPATPAPRRLPLRRPATKPATVPTTATTGASKVRYSPGDCLVWGPKRIEAGTFRNCLIASSHGMSSVSIAANAAALDSTRP